MLTFVCLTTIALFQLTTFVCTISIDNFCLDYYMLHVACCRPSLTTSVTLVATHNSIIACIRLLMNWHSDSPYHVNYFTKISTQMQLKFGKQTILQMTKYCNMPDQGKIGYFCACWSWKQNKITKYYYTKLQKRNNIPTY